MSWTAKRDFVKLFILLFGLQVSHVWSESNWGGKFTQKIICGLTGTTVTLKCSFRYPKTQDGQNIIVEKTLWFINGPNDNPEDLMMDNKYSGRLDFNCEVDSCTLSIKELKKDDANYYKFRFITNATERGYTLDTKVTLQVTDLKVVKEYNRLSCDSQKCNLDAPSYIWYKNAKKMPNSYKTQKIWPPDYGSYSSYSCVIKGHEKHVSPPKCWTDNLCDRVLYNERSICAFKGSSVNISCIYSYHTSIGEKIWFTPSSTDTWNVPSKSWDPQSHRYSTFDSSQGESMLQIKNVMERDSAEYRFKFSAWGRDLPGTTLTVIAGQVEVIKAEVKDSSTVASLYCRTSCSPAGSLSWCWSQNNRPCEDFSTRNVTTITLQPGDYITCAAKGYPFSVSPPLYALEAPRVLLSISQEIKEGDSLTLTCKADTPTSSRHQWYKKTTISTREAMIKGDKLVFSNIQSSDSAEYFCEVGNELGEKTSQPVAIDVKYSPRFPDLSVSPSNVTKEGQRVTLNCKSDADPVADYTFYKDNSELQSSGGTYIFPSISYKDAGNFTCKAQNKYGNTISSQVVVEVQHRPQDTRISARPSSNVSVGSSVSLTCSSDAIPAVTYNWYKDNEESSKFTGAIFNIINFQPDNEGVYHCMAQNIMGTQKATIQLLVKAASPIIMAVSCTMAGILFILLLVTVLLLRKKIYPKGRTHLSTLAQSKTREESSEDQQDELVYSMVAFSNHSPIYSNVTKAKRAQEKDEDESVEYTTVKCDGGASVFANFFHRIHNLAFSAVTPMRGIHAAHISSKYRMSWTAKRDFVKLVILLFGLQVSHVWSESNWGGKFTQKTICGLTGTTVILNCSFWYPKTQDGQNIIVEKTLWFLKRTNNNPEDLMMDNKYSGRLDFNCEVNSCTLSIKELKKDDANDYKFRFITNATKRACTLKSAVTLTVTDLNVGEDWRSYLSCDSQTCNLDAPSYIWYKNANRLPNDYNSQKIWPPEHGSYSCVIKGHEKHVSPPKCVINTCGSVLYNERSICAFKGSLVNIYCIYSYDMSIWEKIWFTPDSTDTWNVPSKSWDPQSHRYSTFDSSEGKSMLQIKNVTERDSAEYRFKFSTLGRDLPGTTLTVIAGQVEVIKAEVKDSSTVASLYCHTSCSPARYLFWCWRQNSRPCDVFSTRNLEITLHPGDYITCAAEGYPFSVSPPLYALEAPRVLLSISQEIKEGDSLTLTCKADTPTSSRHQWYKKTTISTREAMSKGDKLVFSNIQSSDSAEYFCEVGNELGEKTSQPVAIDVKYSPRFPDLSVSPSNVTKEGQRVTLNCKSDADPVADYTFYKDNSELQSSGGTYIFSSISYKDAGNFTCKAQNKYGKINSSQVVIEVQYGPQDTRISARPSSEVSVGYSVNLTCSSDANPAATYNWYKDNEESSKFTGAIFNIINFQPDNEGVYHCKAQNIMGTQKATIQLLVKAASPIIMAVSCTMAGILFILLLVTVLLLRKKIYPKGRTHLSTLAQSKTREESSEDQQDELVYSMVAFSKHSPIYSNVTKAKRAQVKDEDESVEYTTVKCDGSASVLKPKMSTDVSAVYSNVQ
ncbi:basement membrane-specific heparan sulfate proteoglycan core protein-like [Stigmatopora argus]